MFEFGFEFEFELDVELDFELDFDQLDFKLRATPRKYRPKRGKARKIKIALLWHTDRL